MAFYGLTILISLGLLTACIAVPALAQTAGANAAIRDQLKSELLFTVQIWTWSSRA